MLSVFLLLVFQLHFLSPCLTAIFSLSSREWQPAAFLIWGNSMVDINQKALAAATKARNAAPEYPKTDYEALSIALQEHITGTAARFRALETRIHRLETKGGAE